MIKKSIILPQIPTDVSSDQKYFYESILKVISELNLDMYKSVMPVGSTYLQLPNMQDPNALFGGKWEDVSADYAGAFFRVEGGSAEAFETGTQPQEASVLVTVKNNPTGFGAIAVAMASNTGTDGTFGTENRPLNYTIRVWKRVA